MELRTIGNYVAANYRTAAVFNKYGIDFCCKGHRTLEEVSTKKNLNLQDLEKELSSALSETTSGEIDYQSWPLDLLADYVEKTHHRYVEDKVPVLKQFLEKLCKVHGANHPELFEITELFVAGAGELVKHMKKEELILFPFVKKMVEAHRIGAKLSTPHFETVENPIASMMHEHDVEGERFRKISELTDGYTPPQDACNTYKVTFAMLKEFEEDLHKHIHLENNIMFPGALALENKVV